MAELIPGAMSRWLDQQGLVHPSVPEMFRGRLREVAPLTWATEPVDPLDLYMFDFSGAALSALSNDSYAISHAGHGINSYAVTVRLAVPGLTLAVQELWGGLYLDRESARLEVAAMFRAVAECLALAESRPDKERFLIASPFRLVCYTGVLSDFHAPTGQGWMPHTTWAGLPGLLVGGDGGDR